MSIRLALAGNPNCGKTTMFNDLTGATQYVGNWPGVTVEKKEGRYKADKQVFITDLPGIYSLSPYTLEEVITRDYLVGEKPDAILNLVDASNIERNLYLTTQLLEMGIPVVVALNMMDIVEKRGDTIDTAKLSAKLGVPVVETTALKGKGTKELIEAAKRAAKSGAKPAVHAFSDSIEQALGQISSIIADVTEADQRRWFAVKLFERDEKVLSRFHFGADTLEKLEKIITAVEDELDYDAESIITDARYQYITEIVKPCVKKQKSGMTVSDKIDRIVTNRILALPIFALVMFIVYYVSVTTVGTILTDWANDGVFGEGWELFGVWIPGIPTLLGGALSTLGVADWLYSLIMDGIVAGVGAVLGFVPQILVLFLFLAILEDCGYMARVAFIMDRIFRKFGLSGKSFIPMLIGTGCGVPGIMASRTIEQERDRRMTIMTTTFIPCSAKLPIIALIAGAISTTRAGWPSRPTSLACWRLLYPASCSRSSGCSRANRLRSSWSCRAITCRPRATCSARWASAADRSSVRQAPLFCSARSYCGFYRLTAGKTARSVRFPTSTTACLLRSAMELRRCLRRSAGATGRMRSRRSPA